MGGEAVLSWNGADPGETLQSLLQASSRLLQPESGDSASLYVGSLLSQMLRVMPGIVRFSWLWLPLLNASRICLQLPAHLLFQGQSVAGSWPASALVSGCMSLWFALLMPLTDASATPDFVLPLCSAG